MPKTKTENKPFHDPKLDAKDEKIILGEVAFNKMSVIASSALDVIDAQAEVIEKQRALLDVTLEFYNFITDSEE